MAGAAAASSLAASANAQEKMIICAFSKHFQWTTVQELATLCAGFGYEGIDLTLRSGGHVLPERVEDDLPKAVEIIKKAGLKIPMITAGIEDVKSPHAEKMIKTLAAQGIRKYRWGGFRYKDNAGIPEQLVEFKARVKDLAAMNKQYGVCAMYHTHSGVGQVGASMWDLYLLLKDFDTNAVSVNYDVGHAVVEGGYGGWIHSSRLLMPYIRGVAVKDFKWKQTDKGWVPGWCALGQGMVNFKKFLPMLKAANFTGPLQLHMEYPDLGGADTGKTTFTIPKDQLLAIMKRDLDTLKNLVREAGLA
jgi:sugar phosphate isomerase/epimerase